MSVWVKNLFYVVGIVSEAALFGVLIYRRVWRKLPVFFAYCTWALLGDAFAYGLREWSSGGYGMTFYVTITALDLALQLSVLVELSWSVLHPLRPYLSRKALFVVTGVILLTGAAIWPSANIPGLAVPSQAWHSLIQLQQTASILRILLFIVLAGCSHFLSLGWRDRELQVATGFGFYSLVSLAVAILNTRQATAAQFNHLYWGVAASFICSLIYWAISFAQKDAERRDFTPQMQSALLALAESVHVTRGKPALAASLFPGIAGRRD
jgi:hypothetical protein